MAKGSGYQTPTPFFMPAVADYCDLGLLLALPMTKRALIGGMWLLLLSFATEAQQIRDSTYVASAGNNAIQFYAQTIGSRSNLFNGIEYRDYVPLDEETPLLFSDVVYGSVVYDGERYDNVPMYYDIEKDVLLVSYPQGTKVQLLPERVSSFEMENRRFANLRDGKVSPGYYEVLYDGNMKFYAHRDKELKLRQNGNETSHEFDYTVKYYILKNGVYHTVKSKRSVLNLVSDRAKELKRSVRESKLKFGKNREKAITYILTRYEQNR